MITALLPRRTRPGSRATRRRQAAVWLLATVAGFAVCGPASPASATPTDLCGQHDVVVAEATSAAAAPSYLTAGQSLHVVGSQSIWAGYWLTGQNGPEGWSRLGGSGYPLPSARAFSLIARVGDGPWQYVGTENTVTNTGTRTARVYFGINDNVHGNGSGNFVASYVTCDRSDAPGTQNSIYDVVAMHSGKCLDVAGVSTGPGANVQQWHCIAGQPNQQWTARPVGGGYYQVVAAHSGQCLDVANYGYANGDNVRQMPCSAQNAAQQWLMVRQPDGTFEARARMSGKCLDVEAISTADGANVFVWQCLGAQNQRWRFVPTF